MSALCEIPASTELISERLDRIRCETEQLLKKHEERLRFPLAKLGERYVKGQLCLHVHFKRANRLHDSDSATCAVFHCAEGLATGVHKPLEQVLIDSHQFPVFVELVQQVNLQERMVEEINSVVWLQTVNSCQRGEAGDALYFSTETGMFHFAVGFPDAFLSRLADGKLDFVRKPSSPFRIGKLPNEVVERRSKMVDNLASQDAKTRNLSTAYDDLTEYLKSLPVVICQDGLIVGPSCSDDFGKPGEKLRNFDFEIADVLVGPF